MIAEFIAGLIGILAFGTVGFWILFAAVTILMLGLIENEKGLWATVSIFGTLLLLQWLGDIKAYTFIYNHSLWSLGYFMGYLFAGTAWSVCKWWFYVRHERERYDEARTAFLHSLRSYGMENSSENLASLDQGKIPDQKKRDWQLHLASQKIRVNPQAQEHKQRIYVWMMYWPWSFAWTMVNDPIKKLYRAIYMRIRVLMQSISDRAFRGTEDDLRMPDPPKESVRDTKTGTQYQD